LRLSRKRVSGMENDAIGFLLVVTWIVQGIYNSRYTREIRLLKKQLEQLAVASKI
jgi:hypothetical protein